MEGVPIRLWEDDDGDDDEDDDDDDDDDYGDEATLTMTMTMEMLSEWVRANNGLMRSGVEKRLKCAWKISRIDRFARVYINMDASTHARHWIWS